MIISLDPSKKKKAVYQGIRDKHARQMEAVVAPYSPEERETWFYQIMEADAYLANNQAEIPMITAMAANRGISIPDMVAKIKANDLAFRQAVGNILGSQQKELDKIDKKLQI